MKPKLNRNHRNYIDEILVFAKKNKAPKEIKIKPQTQFEKKKQPKLKHSDSTSSHGPGRLEVGGKCSVAEALVPIQLRVLSQGWGQEGTRRVEGRSLNQHTTVMVQQKSTPHPLQAPSATSTCSGLGREGNGDGLELHSEMGWTWLGKASGASNQASHYPNLPQQPDPTGQGSPAGPSLGEAEPAGLMASPQHATGPEGPKAHWCRSGNGCGGITGTGDGQEGGPKNLEQKENQHRTPFPSKD